jgi:type 1 glutamine amidotransferase
MYPFLKASTPAIFAILTFLASLAQAEPQSPDAQLHSDAKISTPQNALFCWSAPDHPLLTHGYGQFANSMADLFNGIDNLRGQAINGFPTDEQWASADLVVFFLTQNNLTESQFQQIDQHLKRGKSILALHQGLVQRGSYTEWANRIGFAFCWDKGATRSKWGKFENHKVTLDTTSQIFSDFPQSITFTDELYWNLQKGSRGKITILGETNAPKVPEEEADRKWPVIWTVQHPSIGKSKGGRTFGAVLGHFDTMRNSPTYQAIILRGVAWCLNEPFEPFEPFEALIDLPPI